jgi:hypothetical protein
LCVIPQEFILEFFYEPTFVQSMQCTPPPYLLILLSFFNCCGHAKLVDGECDYIKRSSIGMHGQSFFNLVITWSTLPTLMQCLAKPRWIFSSWSFCLIEHLMRFFSILFIAHLSFGLNISSLHWSFILIIISLCVSLCSNAHT